MKLKKILYLFVLQVFLFILFSINTSAYNTYNDHKLIGGVGNWGSNHRYYWIDSTATTYTNINRAIDDWIYTSSTVSTPISWLKTSTRSQSVMDFFGVSNLPTGTNFAVLADTTFYNASNSTVDPDNKNWTWCRVRIDRENILLITNLVQRKSVFGHEVGHVMGLDHDNDHPARIMCQTESGRTATEPSANDLRGINHLYN